VTAEERPHGRRWPRWPISLQLVALLLASLVVAQVITFAIIVLMPPPRPAVYRVAEVANALRGGSLATRSGRPMVRIETASLPSDLAATRGERERLRALLAHALDLPDSNVRLVEQSPSPLWTLARRFDRRRRPPGERGLGPPQTAPGAGPDGQGPGGRLRHGRRRFGPGGFAEAPIFGDFAAAAQQIDGRWVVVRSTPEPFPNDWQARTALWLLAGVLLVAPAGYLFARRITAPLKRFAEAAETLGRDPHAPQMTLRGPAEVGAAAQAFNEMQARLRRYVTDRTAMVGAISHDLRTPLARIRFKMEAAGDPLRDSVLADVTQMEQMIGGVLAFIRDEGRPRRRERLDLLSLIECVTDDAATVGADVEIVDGRPVTVDGDPVALQRLFANLVDNAVRYGHAARIQVRRQADAAVVEIADRGAGLTPAELQQVFQPFYRADSSRNLDNGGVGLGLPIARSTARAHGGDVDLASGPAGTTAIVTLPAVG
jgi:signal transduction histidine kinase